MAAIANIQEHSWPWQQLLHCLSWVWRMSSYRLGKAVSMNKNTPIQNTKRFRYPGKHYNYHTQTLVYQSADWKQISSWEPTTLLNRPGWHEQVMNHNQRWTGYQSYHNQSEQDSYTCSSTFSWQEMSQTSRADVRSVINPYRSNSNPVYTKPRNIVN